MTTLHVERVSGGGTASASAPPLVLLHGWGLNLRVWDEVTPPLAADRDVLALDLPGHGRSAFDADATSLDAQSDAVLAALPARCALLGWSLGGQLALEAAIRAPERIATLVLVATTPRFTQAGDWPHGMRPAVLAGFADRLEQDYRTTVIEFLELQVRGSRGSEAVLAKLRRALLEHGDASPPALRAGLALLRAVDARDRLATVRQPALVISGQYDRVTPPAAGRALAAAVQQGVYVEMRRAAHAPFLSHPADFVASVGGFLARAA